MRSVLVRSVQAATLTLVLDQGTKWFAATTGSIILNPGGAFSLGWTHSSTVFWASVVGFGLLFVTWPRASADDRVLLAIALAAGASNLADRLTFGGVRDFLDLPAPLAWFPTFNVADLLLTIAVSLLLVGTLGRPPHPASPDRRRP